MARKGYGERDALDAVYVCTMINPRDHRPYTILWNKSSQEVHVVDPATYENGTYEKVVYGYFEATSGHGGDYERSQQATGCPRIHMGTADERKGGQGLLCYTGAAVTVRLADDISMPNARRWHLGDVKDVIAGSPCISSESGTRSHSAETWWKKQKSEEYKRRFPHTSGLVQEVESDEPVEKTARVTVSESISESDVEYAVENEEGDTNVEIQSFSPEEHDTEVRVSYTSNEPGVFDIINADTVIESVLVLHVCDEISVSAFNFGDDEKRALLREVLQEIDLSGIINKPFLKFMETIFNDVDPSGAEWLKMKRRVPFYAPDYEREHPEPFKPNPRRKAKRNPSEPTHSQKWLKVFGAFMEE